MIHRARDFSGWDAAIWMIQDQEVWIPPGWALLAASDAYDTVREAFGDWLWRRHADAGAQCDFETRKTAQIFTEQRVSWIGNEVKYVPLDRVNPNEWRLTAGWIEQWSKLGWMIVASYGTLPVCNQVGSGGETVPHWSLRAMNVDQFRSMRGTPNTFVIALPYGYPSIEATWNAWRQLWDDSLPMSSPTVGDGLWPTLDGVVSAWEDLAKDDRAPAVAVVLGLTALALLVAAIAAKR